MAGLPETQQPNGRRWPLSLALGQLISLLITGTGVFSTMLISDGVVAPAAQSSLNYVLLFGLFVLKLPELYREGCAAPIWYYMLWAVCDVQGNYLVVMAYQYTSVASVMLLDGFSIVCIMLLSWALLDARYTIWHIFATLICIAGLSLTVLSDTLMAKHVPTLRGPVWFGDILVILGSAMYGMSNVLQERLYKRHGCSQHEALGMLGLFGGILSAAQAAILERHALASCRWSLASFAALAGYQLCLFAMYVLTSRFLQTADATVFNLSLLTADAYSAVFSWIVQGLRPTAVFAAAFTTTVSGLVLYHLQPAPTTNSSRSISVACSDRGQGNRRAF